MTLQQHLCDTCRGTEVAVDLEGRVRIKEVGVGTAVGILTGGIVGWQQAEHVLQDGESMGAVEHTCPETDLPSQTPACGSITTVCQGLLGSSIEFVMVEW